MGPYLIVFALVCGVLCYGLMRRPAWMWYLGWVILYLQAGYCSLFFFSELSAAQNIGQLGHSSLYLVGGLLFWLPAVVWWSRIRETFGKRKGTRSSDPPVSPEP